MLYPQTKLNAVGRESEAFYLALTGISFIAEQCVDLYPQPSKKPETKRNSLRSSHSLKCNPRASVEGECAGVAVSRFSKDAMRWGHVVVVIVGCLTTVAVSVAQTMEELAGPCVSRDAIGAPLATSCSSPSEPRCMPRQTDSPWTAGAR